MSQSQLPTTESLAGPITEQAKKADKAKGKTKPKPKTLKRVLPSGPGFQMYQNAAGEDIKILEDMDEGMAFKNALRAVSPNLDKEAVDLAMAKLFLEADRLSGHQAHITESIPGLLLLAAKQTDWIIAAKKEMKPTVAAKVLMALYEGRRIAVKFSRYRQHPIEDYAKETATALAIDKFRNEKPCDEPEEIFADFTDEQRKKMMGKIIRREKADWDGAHVDEDSDTEMGLDDAKDFEEAQKAAKAKLQEALEQKMKELGIAGTAGFLA
ncbi:hypothetical protein HER10_EVM0000074 [Colletotrichum scovillei]|uniref:Alpha-ketoglutarate-dependent sulfonate dioxygenase n=1 Tax=Colletotrichum scovillei TaxID=1209932 RepID=A0A9P7RD23_9PEZI|nr:uncharacterized protein HER10_EVM0000074 [Colletotrichum scovillei]KAF4783769.1 hypothetical protein HER10_EVM0000074 [Colletotrichum scovillei]KAG7054282.1 alpha-ketoglutarate-dependent sulfonate dioxygenase [Colletotrichum scovillei]KAG7072576.1 alpha-ketoglutarate-dependent sulfonate dioxygenase [Colletotrichum scovillei]KAG7080593.1 alpha-ketoglutarate-dependent sulfonate dioxygenase [Colletotrichum scovillei]